MPRGAGLRGHPDRSVPPWPTGSGFEHFYGFIGGENNQYYPALYDGTTPVEPERTPDEGYHLMEDLADKAIGWMRQQKSIAPDKPFFVYFAPGATHAPHHVPPEWIAKYHGQFDDGWDNVLEETLARQKELGVIQGDCELTGRPEGIRRGMRPNSGSVPRSRDRWRSTRRSWNTPTITSAASSTR